MDTLDIGSKGGYPSAALSNFAGHKFVFDGVDCGSMEGLLQSLKFEKEHTQREVCKLIGVAAKHKGRDKNTWKLSQKLWWGGEAYDRKGDDYQHLLDRAFLELTRQNEEFRAALLATHDKILTHKIGKSNQSDTVLTQSEFCNRLMKIRSLLARGDDLTRASRL